MRKEKFFPTKVLLLIILLLIVLTAGCSSKEVVTSPPSKTTETETPSPIQISHKVYAETLRDDEDGTILLELKITYPEIKNPGNDSSISKINEYYEVQLDDFITNIISEGLAIAREDKEFAKSAEYEFRPHEYNRSFSIRYNGNNLLSVLSLQYQNTGGAHPNSFWCSETFNVSTGKKLTLPDILGGSREDALNMVYETVLAQIKETEGTDKFIFFEDCKNNARNYYSEDDFVLTENSFMFYYQLYTLAPYAVGFPVFEIPFAKLDPLAMNIPVLPVDKLENELYNRAEMLIDLNKVTFYEIFGLSMLAVEIPENPPNNNFVFPVKDERFTTFAELEGFVRNIYVKSEADSLLNNGRYQNIDGKLYADISKDGGVGYYVYWNNYSYEINDLSQTSATLLIYTTDDSPAGKENITITAKMQKENSTWL